jgi:L-amino acid N-acyltransferase YncA
MIRDARESDAAAIAAIYAHHVLHGTATYDVEPPSAEDMVAKIRTVEAAGWPYIVDVENGEVAGFAYATQIRDRAAYAWTAEDSLYVHPDQRGKGVGTSLLDELCKRAEACGFRQMIGVIGGAEPASVRVHARCGFREVGRVYGVGWKHGRWLDNVYMQRALGKGSREPPSEA